MCPCDLSSLLPLTTGQPRIGKKETCQRYITGETITKRHETGPMPGILCDWTRFDCHAPMRTAGSLPPQFLYARFLRVYCYMGGENDDQVNEPWLRSR